MDSRLLAGAYSKTYQALEQAQLDESERYDSLARAKKLSLETNKRRKLQAHKRKLEAQREERRRQIILARRREEQKLATEKYQRSHIPPNARHGSGRLSPRRQGFVLDDALWLIRGNQHDRPKSAVVASSKNENETVRDTWYQPILGQSNRALHTIDRNIRSELLDSSLENFTNSKTLFEQELEHQQQLLLEQQQQSLREFNKAIQKEIEADQTVQGTANNADDGTIADNDMDSFSSMDSLDSLNKEERTRGDSLHPQSANGQLGQGYYRSEHEYNNNAVVVEQHQFFLHGPSINQTTVRPASGNSTFRLTQDMTASALHETNSSPASHKSLEATQLDHQPYSGPTAGDIIKSQSNVQPFHVNNQSAVNESGKMTALKQFSTDSLESVSSISTISQKDSVRSEPQEINKYVNQGDQKNQAQGEGRSTGVQGHNHNAWVSSTPPHAFTHSDSNKGSESFSNSFQPRYASAIGSTIWPGHSSRNQSTPQLSSASGNISSTAMTIASTAVPIVSRTESIVTRAVPIVSTAVPIVSTAVQIATTAVHIVSTAVPIVSIARPIVSTASLVSNNLVNVNSQQAYLVRPDNAIDTTPDFNKPIVHYPQAYYLQPQAETQNISHQSSLSPIESSGAANRIAKSQLTSVEVVKPELHSTVEGLPPSGANEKSVSFSQPIEQRVVNPPKPNSTSKTSAPDSILSQKEKTVLFKDNVTNTKVDKNTNLSSGNVGVKALAEKDKTVNTGSLTGMEQYLKDDEKAGDDLEDAKPVKGILKQSPVNLLDGDGHNNAGKPHPRDSLELARFQHDKKLKKKSVRFAENHIEETEYDEDISVASMLRPNRPTSAKVGVMLPKSESMIKVPRASSAGQIWQTHDDSAQLQIRNVQQMENTANYLPDNPRQPDMSSVFVNGRSNLPPSFTMPLNTSAPIINRPKAAAHIIISSEAHHQNIGLHSEADKAAGPPISTSAGTVAHKSNLDTKVKSINNNFMSKVPVKVQAPSNTNTVVYHATFSGNGSYLIGNKAPQTSAGMAESSNQQSAQDTQYNDRSKIRDNANRRLAISNQTVTRTSIVPASTKITYPQSNFMVPSYSTNAVNNNGRLVPPVFDENGLRIDRTPTDEEIEWLWDNVRSCLHREDVVNKQQNGGSTNSDQGQRPPPSLSTKLIDGTSLGFGATKNANVTRNGAGFFQPHTSSAVNNQGKPRPAILQQGSYLKRFGLLKQRRTNSANALGGGPNQTRQRANSAAFNRQPTVHPLQSTASNGYPDGPTPIALAYRPQEAVSESTAAFLMAERLAKQSLSDSHIQLAMEDAKSKQEAYNRAKFMAAKAGGPSALSLEEHRLMESLDRLNEKLQVLDPGKNNGTIHFHQPYQTQVKVSRLKRYVGHSRQYHNS